MRSVAFWAPVEVGQTRFRTRTLVFDLGRIYMAAEFGYCASLPQELIPQPHLSGGGLHANVATARLVHQAARILRRIRIHSFVHPVVAIAWFTLFPMRLNCKSK
jgi:hypothetical protein